MRRFLLALLLILLLNVAESAPSKFAINLGKKLVMNRKLAELVKQRKLQSTDDTTDGGESNNVPSSTNNTNAKLQILDFSGFEQGTASGGKTPFSFIAFFYFLGIEIPDTIFLPLKVNLGSLRNLEEQDIEAECTPEGDSSSDDQGGKSQKFKCEGSANGEGTITSLAYDDSRKIRTVKNGKPTYYGGEDIFFGEGANSVKDNIHSATTKVEDYYTLKNGEVENDSPNDGKFNVNGALDKSIDTINNQNLNLGINDTTSLTCGISGSTESSVLSCNTNNEPLEANLHGKSGLVTIDDKNYKVVLTMKSDSATVTEGEVTSTSSPTYRKSSSGLSGGAIAGIVIACVVVLIAAAVAAIMLRKPTPPPVDNTTVSGLKTVENL